MTPKKSGKGCPSSIGKADEDDEWNPEVESNADAKPKASAPAVVSSGEQENTPGDELLDQLTTKGGTPGGLRIPGVDGLLLGKIPRVLSRLLLRLGATNPEVRQLDQFSAFSKTLEARFATINENDSLQIRAGQDELDKIELTVRTPTQNRDAQKVMISDAQAQ